MYGAALERGPQGRLAQVSARRPQPEKSASSYRPLTSARLARRTRRRRRIEFQMAPGTEAPAEMHFYFPRYRALCMAENATHTLHNLLTLRGALVRDPHVWRSYLTEAIEMFGARTDVVFASHHWPTWGSDRIVDFWPHNGTYTPTCMIRRCGNQPGVHGIGDRRDHRTAAGTGACLEHPGLLRLRQPQRQGRLPAVYGLV